MGMKFVQAYYDWLVIMEPLADDERGRLITAALIYASTGEVLPLSGPEKYVFPTIRLQIDRDRDSYDGKADKNRANGSLGGRPVRRKADAISSDISPKAKPNGLADNRTVLTETQKSQDKEEEKEEDEDVNARDDGFLTDEDAASLADGLNAVLDMAAAIGIPQTSRDLERGNELVAQYTAPWVLEALHRAGDTSADKRCWRYVAGILKKWRDSGGIDAREKPPDTVPDAQKPKVRFIDHERTG